MSQHGAAPVGGVFRHENRIGPLGEGPARHDAHGLARADFEIARVPGEDLSDHRAVSVRFSWQPAVCL